MKILLLLDKYIPMPQANGVCANHVLRAIPDAQISVVCKVNDPNIVSGKGACGENVYSIYAPGEVPFAQRSILRKVLYVCRHLGKALLGPVFNRKIVTSYYKVSCRIIDENKPDLIMAVLNPLESVEALYRLKARYPRVATMIYDLDTASKCGHGRIEERLKGVYQKRILFWEQKVFRAADLIVHLTQFRQHFSQKEYAEFAQKTLYQEIPLLESKKNADVQVKPLSFIYSGSFYPGLRDPERITDIMDVVLEKSKVSLSVYTKGAPYKMLLEKYKVQESVFISEYIPEEELEVVVAETEFLLSLGNKKSQMFPSKIVSYVSALKPIIHIYQSEDDPVNGYLKDYPVKLLLNAEDGPGYNAEQIIAFIQKDHPQIFSEQITALYYKNSGAYNADMILDFFKVKKNDG